MKDNRTKVTINTINQMKKLFNAGTKQKHIANAFGVSVSTIQNAKRCNFDYIAYKEFVDGQFRRWKLSRNTQPNKSTTTNVKAITAVSNAQIDWIAANEAKMDWIVDKLADIEIRLRVLELKNK
tara:strand:+ start:59 stop:430 length:372 start_codon:yes stop_codon:yes gene_type:complete